MKLYTTKTVKVVKQTATFCYKHCTLKVQGYNAETFEPSEKICPICANTLRRQVIIEKHTKRQEISDMLFPQDLLKFFGIIK